jgi:branched-subunit amino acid transport protein
MTSGTDYFLIVMAMGAVTYLPRWLPLFALARRRLPAWVLRWLDLIPAAVLSALVAPALLTSGDPRQVDVFRPEFYAAVPTLLFALKTRSLGGTVVTGMALYWLLS